MIGAHPAPFAAVLRAAATLRRIIGVPDYATYARHMREHHPDCAVMDERAFERERLAARYMKPGSRCC